MGPLYPSDAFARMYNLIQGIDLCQTLKLIEVFSSTKDPGKNPVFFSYRLLYHEN